MNEKIGTYLSKKAVEYLIKNKQLSYLHKEYCGTGFYYDGSRVFYTYFYDGFPDLNPHKNEDSVGGIIKEFNNFTDFQIWLESQTNDSLSGKELQQHFYKNNQRITRERLQELFAYNVLNDKNLD